MYSDFHYKPVSISKLHEKRIFSLAPTWFGVYSCGEDGKLIRMHKDHQKCDNLNHLHKPFFDLVAANGILFAGCMNGKIYGFDTSERVWKYEFRGLEDFEVRSFGVSANGQIIAGTDCGKIGMWHKLDAEVRIFDIYSGPVQSVCVHPKKEIAATCSNDGRVHVWDLSDFDLIHDFESDVVKTKFDGIDLVWYNQFLFVSANEIEMYDGSFELVRSFKKYSAVSYSLAVTGNLLFAASDRLITWNYTTGSIHFHVLLDEEVSSLTVSSDGRHIYLGLESGSVQVWEVNE